MEAYKFNNTIFVKPSNMLFNAVGMDEITDLRELEYIEKLRKAKEIFNSLECVWITTMFWEFNDTEKKITLKGTITRLQEKELEIINLKYLKQIAELIGYKIFKSVQIID